MDLWVYEYTNDNRTLWFEHNAIINFKKPHTFGYLTDITTTKSYNEFEQFVCHNIVLCCVAVAVKLPDGRVFDLCFATGQAALIKESKNVLLSAQWIS